MEKEDVRDKLLMQLHEQYAQNNNANLNSVVILLVALIAVIGFYGNVFLHTGQQIGDITDMYNNGEFTLAGLSFVTIATFVVITVMSVICIYQGSAQRKEQFITYAIRERYGLNTLSNIFPNGYTPKRKRCLQVIQGLFGEFVKIFFWLELFIIGSYLAKVLYLQKTIGCNCNICNNISLTVILFILCLLINAVYLCRRICKYYKTEEEYN